MQQTMKLLEEYIENFYGYGNLNSDFWFIGKEEAGGRNKEDVISRITEWSNKGAVLDIKKFHYKINPKAYKELFTINNQFKTQATWRGLIKLQYFIENKSLPNKEQVKDFQCNKLGQYNSNNCLLELFPLPAPSTSVYDYKNWFPELDYLKNRRTYKSKLKERRISVLKNLIEKHTPKVVFFYSTDKEYVKYWKEISNYESKNTIIIKNNRVSALIEKINNTVFVICPHPVAHGVTNDFFENVGSKVVEIMN